MTSFEVREKFLNFFQKNQHKVLPSSSLIPNKDPSLLFVNAGMNQFKNIFLGLEKTPVKNVVTIQQCLRAGGKHNDLDNVGQSHYHHTFFEMMGNFSFGFYFKQKAIALAWEFLTQELDLDPKDLWVSVYEKDEESYEIWRSEQKIPEHKIYRLGKKDNLWQMGDTGPCGPCTEIHLYKGTKRKPDPDQFMEIWNLVFMEFNDTEEGTRQKLSVPCVDTGMSLERLTAVVQNRKSNYHTDLFSEILLSLEQSCSYKYDFEEKTQTEKQKAFRVLADHSRAVCFLINNGIVPGNEGAYYVLRRIIRRALYYSQKLQPKKNLLQVGAEKTVSLMATTYPELKQVEGDIQIEIEREAKMFFDNLKRGRKQLEETMESLPEKFIPARTVWNLYSTYGFPTDLTRLIAKEEGWTAAAEEDIKKHEEKVKQQKTGLLKIQQQDFIKKFVPRLISELHRKIQKTAGAKTKMEKQNTDSSSCKRENIPLESQKEKLETTFTGYEKNKETGQVLLTAYLKISDPQHNEGVFTNLSTQLSLQPIIKEQEGWLVLDKSCFYPEGGGPVGDRGLLKTKTGTAEVLDCQKEGNFIWHKVRILEGRLEEGQKCQMEVNVNHRKEISASHTATHLLNSALRSVLGESVRQAGSLVEPGYLRFDFTYPKALAKKECQHLEEQIWQSIEKEENVSSSSKSLDQAKKEGVLFLQGENYDPKVRVISIGKQTSKELCGGIHVQNTREIESFKIISEKGIQSGVRRIVAYTGHLAKIWESLLAKQNLELRDYLKLPLPEEKQADTFFIKKEKLFWKSSIEKQNPFLEWVENKDQEFKSLRKRIVQLEEKELKLSFSKNQDFVKINSRFHPLAQQNLELREFLKLPLPKEKDIGDSFLKQKAPDEKSSSKNQEVKQLDNQMEQIESLGFAKEKLILQTKDCFEESENPLIAWVKNKEEEFKKLHDQWEKIKNFGLTKDSLMKQAKDFNLGGLKGKLLVLSFPLEDRKILSDLSDSLLYNLSSGVLILLGEVENKHPVLVSRTKNFEKILSAGDILKDTIAPLCKGKGGGKASFAQGSITDKSAFSHLEKILLEKWSIL